MKRTIKLTESDLRHLIKESIKSVLAEGKTVNNKPQFDEYGFVNKEVLYKLIDRCFKDKDYANHDSVKAFLDELSRYRCMGDKIRDERRKQRRPEDNMIRAKREREELVKMLRTTDVSLKEYQNMSYKERKNLEDYYYTIQHRRNGYDPTPNSPSERWNEYGEYLGCY